VRAGMDWKTVGTIAVGVTLGLILAGFVARVL
jgi:hypothetical protein